MQPFTNCVIIQFINQLANSDNTKGKGDFIMKNDFMQQVYHANPSYDINSPILDTQTTFFLNNKGRLYKIVYRTETSFDGTREHSWGNEKREYWNLEGDANENDLINAFTKLALGNPTDFKELYSTLKEHDKVVFPCIQKALENVRELFNFD